MDLDDLDNDLLGLGDEEESEHSDSSSRPRRSGGASAASRRRASPDSAPAAKKRSKPSAKKSRRKRKDDSDEDDGDEDEDDDALFQSSEDMSVSNASDLSEAEMVQSESDGESNLYPLEGRYKDAADRERIQALPELEREEILTQRADEIQSLVEKRELANVLKSRINKNRSSPRASRRSARTKSAPQKSGDKKSAQLNELMKKREEKSNKKAAAASGDRKKRKRSESASLSEGEEGEEEESDEEVQWVKSEAPKKLREPVLDDFNKLRLGRYEIVKYWHYSNFEEVAKDCYVRFSLGPDQETGRPVYRMCRIKGFEPSNRIYDLASKNRNTKINRNVVIAIGESTRVSRMDVLSDSAITEDEFRWYKAAMDTAREPMPSLRTIERKIQEIKDLTNKTLSQEEFREMIKRRNDLNPNVMTATVRIKALTEQRKAADIDHDESEVSRIDREIEQLEAVLSGAKNPLSLQKREETQMERLALLNKQNRKTNMQEIRKAELVEKRRNMMAAKAMATNGGNASSFMDPFARVKTRAKVFHEETNIDELFGSDNDGGSAGGSKEGTPAPKSTPAELKNSTLSSGAKKKMGVDDVVANMGLDIDIEI